MTRKRTKLNRQSHTLLMVSLFIFISPVHADDIFGGFIPCAESGECGNNAGERYGDEVGQVSSAPPVNNGADEDPDLVADRDDDTPEQYPSTPVIVDGQPRTADLKCAEDDQECQENEIRCNQFIKENDEHGYAWLDRLPDCPCNSDGEELESWGHTAWSGDIKSFTVRKFHPGASGGCYRSAPIDVENDELSAQQCCYTDDNKLITGGSGAGTPDIDAADGFFGGYDPGHIEADSDPWEWCGFEIYNQIRKPNTGNDCQNHIVTVP